jgi:hypothetical protein
MRTETAIKEVAISQEKYIKVTFKIYTKKWRQGLDGALQIYKKT